MGKYRFRRINKLHFRTWILTETNPRYRKPVSYGMRSGQVPPDAIACVLRDQHKSYTFLWARDNRHDDISDEAYFKTLHDAPLVIIWTWIPREQVFEIINLEESL